MRVVLCHWQNFDSYLRQMQEILSSKMDLVHALSQLLNECRWRSKQLIQRCLVDRALDFLIVVHLFLVHLLLWNEHFTVCVDGNFKMNYLLLSSTDISTSSSHSLVTKHSHSTALVFRYEQFLQVGWLYRALILLGLTLCLPSASVSSVFVVLYIDISFFLLTSFSLPFSELSLVGLPLDVVD